MDFKNNVHNVEFINNKVINAVVEPVGILKIIVNAVVEPVVGNLISCVSINAVDRFILRINELWRGQELISRKRDGELEQEWIVLMCGDRIHS